MTINTNQDDDITGEPMINYINRYFMPGDYSHPTATHPVRYNHSKPGYDFDVQYEGGSSYYAVEQGLLTMITLNTYNGHLYGM